MPRTSTRSLDYGPATRGVTAVDGGFMRYAALVVALLISLSCMADESPLTRAESSNYSATCPVRIANFNTQTTAYGVSQQEWYYLAAL